MNFTASADIANKPPTACIGPEKLRGDPIPGDQRSAPLPAIARSFQNGDGRHRSGTTNVVRQADSGTVDLVGSVAAKLLDELVSPESIGEPEIFVADQLDTGEEVMDLGNCGRHERGGAVTLRRAVIGTERGDHDGRAGD